MKPENKKLVVSFLKIITLLFYLSLLTLVTTELFYDGFASQGTVSSLSLAAMAMTMITAMVATALGVQVVSSQKSKLWGILGLLVVIGVTSGLTYKAMTTLQEAIPLALVLIFVFVLSAVLLFFDSLAHEVSEK
ncbi:hypothetical protein KKC60_01005 [Patescibacteria group bacterium]|nr:hypothetical protein [Patescibacteria group bacterium]